MRKIIIGRSNDCDIVISDTTDVVSRRQAVITFTFFGKKTLYDTSVNGTFVNGDRMDKSVGKVVTKSDKINFSHACDLDWICVKDPYRRLKMAIFCILISLMFIVAGIIFYVSTINKADEGVPDKSASPLVTETPKDTIHTTEDSLGRGANEDGGKEYKAKRQKKNSSLDMKNTRERMSPKANINEKKEQSPIEPEMKEAGSNEAPLIY